MMTIKTTENPIRLRFMSFEKKERASGVFEFENTERDH